MGQRLVTNRHKDRAQGARRVRGANFRKNFYVESYTQPWRRDNFRRAYLRQLLLSRAWVPRSQRPPTHQTVIIFDWDDTLLCTSYLNRLGNAYLPRAVLNDLEAIQQAGKMLLELAVSLGPTFVITNATEGWVQDSAAAWIPEVFDALQNQKVRVISARTNHETQYPGEVGKWKVEAFLEVQRELNSQTITNLISLGDSNFEMDAVHIMRKEFTEALVKTIKFHENPFPCHLRQQLQLLTQHFERIVETGRSLRVNFNPVVH
jgi:hypothetical protein